MNEYGNCGDSHHLQHPHRAVHHRKDLEVSDMLNIINYGGWAPKRAHPGDAGADCYALADYVVKPHETIRIPLGFGTEIPDGMVGFILPRSSMASRGLVAQAVPVDSNYRGEIHAIITNYKIGRAHV